MSNKSTFRSGAAAEPLRFAHPFFSPVPPSARAGDPAHGARMLDHMNSTLGPVPATKRGVKISLWLKS